MEKRALIAIVASMVILFAWQYLFTPKTPQQATQTQKQEGQTQTAPGGPATTWRPAAAGQLAPSPMPQAPIVLKTPAKLVTVDTSKMTVTLGNLGGGVTSVRLKEYKETVGGREGKELVQDIAPYQYFPVVSKIVAGQTLDDAVPFTADKRGDIAVSARPETVVLTGKLADGTKVRKIYNFFPDAYSFNLKVETEGTDRGAGTFADFAVMSQKEKSSYIFRGPFVYGNKKFEQVAKLDTSLNAGAAYQYAGFDEGYFSFIMQPRGTTPGLLITKVGATPIDRLLFTDNSIDTTLYFVPNKISLLKQLNIDADKIVNFGWFDIVAKPMLWGMNFSNGFTHNYGIDIILLTILIKIIFYPLSVKSYKSMKNMQKLQPKLAQLREKHKNDKEKLNQEMMGIYKREGVNPLGGCLPMVIQIPVFFALYRVLMAAIEFRHAPFMLWINDLAAPEDIFTIHAAGYALPFRVLPLIMGITMVIQQKMTPTGGDPMQAKMMMLMPIFFTFLFWGFPAGLVLYWLVNNVISIGQQYYINKQVV